MKIIDAPENHRRCKNGRFVSRLIRIIIIAVRTHTLARVYVSYLYIYIYVVCVYEGITGELLYNIQYCTHLYMLI